MNTSFKLVTLFFVCFLLACQLNNVTSSKHVGLYRRSPNGNSTASGDTDEEPGASNESTKFVNSASNGNTPEVDPNFILGRVLEGLPNVPKDKRSEVVKNVGAVYQLDIVKGDKISGGEKTSWTMDLKNGDGSLSKGPSKDEETVTITLTEDCFMKLLNPEVKESDLLNDKTKLTVSPETAVEKAKTLYNEFKRMAGGNSKK